MPSTKTIFSNGFQSLILALLCVVLLAAPVCAQPQPADLIVSASKVVTMDKDRRVVAGGAVAIRDGRILAIAPRAEIDKAYSAKQRIDRSDAILAPGLVNTHTHAAMSLLRGIADDRNLQDWLENYIFPAEARNVNADFVLWGTRLAMLEMMLSGTTTFTDMYYFEDTVAQAAKDAGMRAVLGQTIIGFPAPDYKTPAAALDGTARFIEKWKNDSLIVPSPAPHAVYTNDEKTLRAAKELADRHGVPLIIHVSETQRENLDVLAKHGLTPTLYLDHIGGIAQKTLFAHGVWITPPERALVKARNIGIAHCPSSNLKLASGIFPAHEFLAAGINVGLGPDGPAGSNNDFNMFEEMDLAAKLAKGATLNPQVLPAAQVFEMATLGGARALHMDSLIGSLEPGKRADLITVAATEPHAIPRHDVYSMLVYALKGADVRDVVIDGRITIRDRKALTLDSALIVRKAVEWRARIEASLKSR